MSPSRDRIGRVHSVPIIVTFTDFGPAGPYLGQVRWVLRREAPDAEVIDLLSDAPTREPMLAAYLLASLVGDFPPGTVFLCVVDPGVGGDRAPVVVEADGRWFVGPENGLFELVSRRAEGALRWWEITWRPARLSPSFHGRDLFAPVAAMLVRGEGPPGVEREPATMARPDWPDDLRRVVYVDHFGNAMTGIRAATVPVAAVVEAGGRKIAREKTYSTVPSGHAFWYENSNGLVEIAVNGRRAADVLALGLGTSVSITP